MTAAVNAMPTLLFCERWPGDQLSCDYPPRFSDANKALCYRLAGSTGAGDDGDIEVAKVAPTSTVTVSWCHAPRLTSDPGFYRYQSRPDPARVDWYVNFADAELFGFYAGALFAQDEMQVVEHPILASVREKLNVLAQRDERYLPRTCSEYGVPTPVLLSGVQRRIAIDTGCDAGAGRPDGLYGHQMAAASPEVIRAAVRRIEPSVYTRVLAMAAPHGGAGLYTRAQLASALHTAWTGFVAARRQSMAAGNAVDSVVMHTGNWGCGAFGGNPVLMLTVQMLAGSWAGIDELIFYDAQPQVWALALHHYRVLQQRQPAVDGVFEYLLSQDFHWGQANGT